jgi:hypothetical protein
LCVSCEKTGVDIKIQKTIYMHRKALLPEHHGRQIAMALFLGTSFTVI